MQEMDGSCDTAQVDVMDFFRKLEVVRHVAEDGIRALPAGAELSARSARIDIGEDEDDQQRPIESDRNAAQAANEAAAAGAEGAASG